MRLLAQDDYYYDTYVDDDEAVRQNQAFQFVVFVLYEMFLIFIFLSIDYLKIFDKPAIILGDNANKNFKLLVKAQKEIGLINAKTASTRDIFIKEHISKLMKQKSEAISESKKSTYNHCCDYPDEMYSDDFFFGLLWKQCFMGCSDIWFKDGIIPIFGFKFPKGLLEDYIYYLLNHHCLLSITTSTRGNPATRNFKRLVFYTTNSFSLMASALLALKIHDSYHKRLLNIFVVSPVVFFMHKFLFYLLVCPCINVWLHDTVDERCCESWSCTFNHRKWALFVITSGHLFAVPIAIGAIGLLFIGAYLGYASHYAMGVIFWNMVTVVFVSSGIDLVVITRKFFTTYRGIRLSKDGDVKFVISGQWFMQYINYHHLKENDEYTVTSHLHDKLVVFSPTNNAFYPLMRQYCDQKEAGLDMVAVTYDNTSAVTNNV